MAESHLELQTRVSLNLRTINPTCTLVTLLILHQVAKWLLRHISRSCVTRCELGLYVDAHNYTWQTDTRSFLDTCWYSTRVRLSAWQFVHVGTAARRKRNTCAAACRWVCLRHPLLLPSSARSFLARKSRASIAIDRSISCIDIRFELRFNRRRKAELHLRSIDRSISCRDTKPFGLRLNRRRRVEIW